MKILRKRFLGALILTLFVANTNLINAVAPAKSVKFLSSKPKVILMASVLAVVSVLAVFVGYRLYIENLYKKFFKACESGDIETVKYLLDKNLIDVNKSFEYYYFDGDTPIAVACYYGHKEVAKLLIAHGANINKVSEFCYKGQTPFFQACYRNRVENARLLAEMGADVDMPVEFLDNIMSCEGQTALFEACERGKIEIVKLFIEFGADVNKVAEYGFWAGRSPLSIACEFGRIDCVNELLKAKNIDVNNGVTGVNRGFRGKNALFFASCFVRCAGKLDLVKVLLEKGAIACEDTFSMVKDKPEIVKYLKLAKDFDSCSKTGQILSCPKEDVELCAFAEKLKLSRKVKN